jgi:hypothetical protein
MYRIVPYSIVTIVSTSSRPLPLLYLADCRLRRLPCEADVLDCPDASDCCFMKVRITRSRIFARNRLGSAL